MRFFERFKPRHENIEKGEAAEGVREYSLDDARRELNQDLKTKEIISGENPLEPTSEEAEHIRQVTNLLKPDEVEIIRNNMDLIMQEIDENNKKIKQLEDSIRDTEEMEAAGDKAVISADSYRKIIASLQKLNTEKEALIREEESKIVNLPSLN